MQADYSSVLYMILLIGTGFFLNRIRLLEKKHIDALPAILLNIAYPALIIRSFTSVNICSLAEESIYIVVVTIAVTLMLYVAGKLILRRYGDAKRKPLIIFSMAIGNITFVALPVIHAVFGDVGVYYTMLHGMAQDVIIWTLYYSYFVGGGTLQSVKLKKLISPCFISLAVAVVLAAFGLRPQGVADDFLNGLSGMTIPLALVYVGGVLSMSGGIRNWIPGRDAIMISFIKVLVIPLLVFGVMQLVPVSTEIRILMAVCFSAPVAVLSTIWAKQYGYDEKFSIKALMTSTLLFLIAASVFIVLYGPHIIGG